jgi:hypothetical protein
MSTKFIARDSEDIGDAITRSHIHEEIVTVILADGVKIETALWWVSMRSESHLSTPIDRNEAGARREDVWGDDGQGGEFRLYLVEATP